MHQSVSSTHQPSQPASTSQTQGAGKVLQKKNRTGLPDRLKTGIENLSGFSMDDVRVHYNSPKPAQLMAHAYAQGNQIYLGPGQKKHLPHEAWHVVQQKQGRVRPTMQLKGVGVNDDVGLEREADAMGAEGRRLIPKNLNSETIQRIKDVRAHYLMQRTGMVINDDGIIQLPFLQAGERVIIASNDDHPLIEDGTGEGFIQVIRNGERVWVEENAIGNYATAQNITGNFEGYTQGGGEDQGMTLYFENGRYTQQHGYQNNTGWHPHEGVINNGRNFIDNRRFNLTENQIGRLNTFKRNLRGNRNGQQVQEFENWITQRENIIVTREMRGAGIILAEINRFNDENGALRYHFHQSRGPLVTTNLDDLELNTLGYDIASTEGLSVSEYDLTGNLGQRQPLARFNDALLNWLETQHNGRNRA